MSREQIPHTLDLPDPNCNWVASRKAKVVDCIARGLITEMQVLKRYPGLSLEELQSWQRRVNMWGQKGLRVTKHHR